MTKRSPPSATLAEMCDMLSDNLHHHVEVLKAVQDILRLQEDHQSVSHLAYTIGFLEGAADGVLYWPSHFKK